ncbi:MAG: hypothetical protein ACYCQI_05010 [Gammaproteobacteria bacterium]
MQHNDDDDDKKFEDARQARLAALRAKTGDTDVEQKQNAAMSTERAKSADKSREDEALALRFIMKLHTIVAKQGDEIARIKSNNTPPKFVLDCLDILRDRSKKPSQKINEIQVRIQREKDYKKISSQSPLKLNEEEKLKQFIGKTAAIMVDPSQARQAMEALDQFSPSKPSRDPRASIADPDSPHLQTRPRR